ncbi:hypothetical protein [Nocardioides bruguierae]|uniref:hypothetical protein n=1 Tax=Nocardioides bruguierae TaxID=2945102 RepID=UPI0020215A3D|nr:hypothetical protein [Nocardioides bruguierae]MCL8026010.1 hypothetical protein [Nocardioides bruguierae]
MRLETDDLSPTQERNRSWLATHPLALAAILGVVGAVLVPIAYGGSVAGLVGLLGGAAIGWGVSVEYRREQPRGAAKLGYVVVCAATIALLVYLKST